MRKIRYANRHGTLKRRPHWLEEYSVDYSILVFTQHETTHQWSHYDFENRLTQKLRCCAIHLYARKYPTGTD